LLSAHLAVSLRTLRPADQPFRARESKERAVWHAEDAALVAPSSGGAGHAIPGGFPAARHSVLGLSASSGRPTRVLQPFIDRIVKVIYRFVLITGLELYLFSNELC
jgi:hypothetical protein